MNKNDLWVQTMTGKSFHPFNPHADEIAIEDIAHGLSLTCRFGGQSKTFYSVAQHCVLLTKLVPAYAKYWALMHDAAEAYVGDLPTPIKDGLPDFKKMEDNILDVIVRSFNIHINTHIHKVVKQADTWLGAFEARHLMDSPDWAEAILAASLVNPRKVDINPWDADTAKINFILTFQKLKKRNEEYAHAC